MSKIKITCMTIEEYQLHENCKDLQHKKANKTKKKHTQKHTAPLPKHMMEEKDVKPVEEPISKK